MAIDADSYTPDGEEEDDRCGKTIFWQTPRGTTLPSLISSTKSAVDSKDLSSSSSQIYQQDSSLFIRDVRTKKLSPLNHRFHSTPSKQQYAIIQPGDRALIQRATSKRHHQRLSSCLFYAIFVTGTFSLIGWELFIRIDISKPTPQMGPRNNYVVPQTKINGDKKKKRLQQTGTKVAGRKVRYPNRRQEPHFQTIKFTQVPESRKKSWPLDPLFYMNEESNRKERSQPQVVYIDEKIKYKSVPHPAAFLFPLLDSDDADMSGREMIPPHEDGECVPMKEWQTAYYPTCNEIHQIDVIQQSHPNFGGDMHLFGTNGYWRNAWKVDYSCLTRNNNTHISKCNETVVLKTLKFQHNFEESHYEHNRIDAMAMERLTSSPHVINIFGACGNSVITEFADGERVGALADKKKKKPLERLKIALDIARGLVALHSIDGDEEATFVHFDVNLANVVSIGGRLKLNDFNIGVILKRNETSGKACGFPAKYPNPQVDTVSFLHFSVCLKLFWY